MSGPGIAYTAALALAAVFAWAGTAKVRRRGATARAFAALGLRSPEALSVGVPASEVALAVGLVVAPAWAGVAALAVLAGFTTFLVLALRRGQAVACGCFGAARPAPIGPTEVVRNLVLVVAALAAAFAAGPVLPGVGEVVLVAAAAAGARALVLAVGRRAPAPSLSSGPPVGSTAPPLPGVRYQDHQRTLVAFVAPTCEGCDELRSSLARHDRPGVWVELADLDDASRTKDFAAFAVRSTPYLVVVDHDGRVSAGGPARSEADVGALAAE